MPTGVGTAAVVAATTVGTQLYSIQQKRKANKLMAERAEEQKKAQELQAAKERRSIIRRKMLERSRALVQGNSMGMVGGSGLSGGLSSLSSQVGANLGYGSQLSGINQNIASIGSDINQVRSNISTAQGISGLTSSLLSPNPQTGMSGLEAIQETFS